MSQKGCNNARDLSMRTASLVFSDAHNILSASTPTEELVFAKHQYRGASWHALMAVFHTFKQPVAKPRRTVQKPCRHNRLSCGGQLHFEDAQHWLFGSA